MNKLVSLIMLLSLTACVGRTQYGECVGALGEKNPKYYYEYSGWNIAAAVLLGGSVLVPAIVVFDRLKCPVAVK